MILVDGVRYSTRDQQGFCSPSGAIADPQALASLISTAVSNAYEGEGHKQYPNLIFHRVRLDEGYLMNEDEQFIAIAASILGVAITFTS